MVWFLELRAGELTNLSLAEFAWLTMLIRKPFTIAYAKDTTPQEHWDSPLFKRINNVITAVWASAFTLAAAVGFSGDLVFHDAGNFWTGWILQIGGHLLRGRVHRVLRRLRDRQVRPGQRRAGTGPSVVELVEWLPTFVTVTGIAGLVGSIDFVVGIALIVTGSAASGVLAKVSPKAAPQ